MKFKWYVNLPVDADGGNYSRKVKVDRRVDRAKNLASPLWNPYPHQNRFTGTNTEIRNTYALHSRKEYKHWLILRRDFSKSSKYLYAYWHKNHEA